ncbi:MAG: mannose-6-phosphate isomerase, class I [Polyangiaceae bacterium]
MGRVKAWRTVHLTLLKNPIQTYAWGSRSVIASLEGRAVPSDEPEAELWIGAHPSAPSLVLGNSDPTPLPQWIAARSSPCLGAAEAELGSRLPFLLKVLAAAQPLSLQAHPNAEQARAGFEAEERAGVPRDAPHRCYRDDSHKPELLCALTEFDALCGFRPVAETSALLRQLADPELDVLAERVVEPDGLRGVFQGLYALGDGARKALVNRTLAACRRQAAKASFADSFMWALRLAELYPGDIGVVTSLLLNVLRLQPGQAIYLPAGNLHAYLEGAGVEIMASSDNVLRGGLTVKHVDVPELMKVLDFRPLVPAPVSVIAQDGRQRYETPAREFCLERVELVETLELRRARPGPEIWLCLEGEASVAAAGEEQPISRGQAVFVCASAGALSLRGNAVLYRALVGALA